MINNNVTKIRMGILLAFALLFAFSSVDAFGVSSAYWDSKPLKLAPGESKEVFLELQNMVGDQDVTLEAAIVGGREIAVLLDTPPVYEVPLKWEGVKARILVTIPRDAVAGSKYLIQVKFSQIGAGGKQGEEMVRIAGGVGGKIPVEVISPESLQPVVEEPLQATPPVVRAEQQGLSVTAIAVMVAILALIIIIGYVIVRSRSKKAKK